MKCRRGTLMLLRVLCKIVLVGAVPLLAEPASGATLQTASSASGFALPHQASEHHAALNASGRPSWTDYPAMARWLVHANDYGTLATVSRSLTPKGGPPVPFGNVVSFSDGPAGNSTGRLLFYLTLMDASAYDLQDNAMATFSVAEAQLPHACRSVDPEDPTCAKASITGRMAEVGAAERPEAQELLFARHPAMRHWPADHGFRIYELHIEAIRLLDWYGGAEDIARDDYFGASVAGEAAASD